METMFYIYQAYYEQNLWPRLMRLFRENFGDNGISFKIDQLDYDVCEDSIFSILVNGVPQGLTVSNKGLRQRGFVSIYLFLLCTEGLISLLKQATSNRLLEWIKIYWATLRINHLLFVYGSIVFCKVNMETKRLFQQVLHKYAQASRQLIN